MADSVLRMYVSLAPVIIAGILNMVRCSTSLAPQLNRPLDNHLMLTDGRRLLGDNKTWKGLVGMVVAGPAFDLATLVDVGTCPSGT